MEAVWPDVIESKNSETPRSTTPVRQESRKKKKEDIEKLEEEKKPKKIKLSSEGWSQESDVEEEDKRYFIGFQIWLIKIDFFVKFGLFLCKSLD